VSEPAGKVVALAPPVSDGRPVIRTSLELHEQGDAAVRVLSSDPDLYQQAGHLVRVVRVDPSCATPERPDGTPEIRRVETETLREQVSRYSIWERYDQRLETWVQCQPPAPVAAAVRKRGQWFGVRPLEAVTESPALRPDGSILDKTGYDAPTRVLFVPSQAFPQVRDRPTVEHARKALAALEELFAQVPFERPEQRYVPIAALLTVVARPAIRGAVPAFGFNSPVAGAGKSLCVQVISSIATGRASEPNTYPDDPVELEKSLGAEALSGAPIIDFDNIEVPVESGPLLKAITAKDKVRLRVLGLSQKVSARWRAVVLLGGVGLLIGRQMDRRVIMANIVPKEERPELRTGFAIKNLDLYALDNRGRLLVAALTILRGYCLAVAEGGERVQTATLGNFEEWCRLVPAAIVWAGGLDVTGCRPAAIQGHEDPETTGLRAVLDHWNVLATSEGATIASVVELLYPNGRKVSPDEGRADGYGPLRTALEDLCPTKGSSPPTRHQIGQKFKKLQGRWIGKKSLKNRNDTKPGETAKWAVIEAP
jgi:putative DNA primase/helicase